MPTSEGGKEGANDGKSDKSCFEGGSVGSIVGSELGLFEGWSVGSIIGRKLGLFEGSRVGLFIGNGLGSCANERRDGLIVGNIVEATVGRSVSWQDNDP